MLIQKAKQICDGLIAPVERFFNQSLLPLFLSEDEKKSHRIAFLDGLRGLAITAVLFFHYYARWTKPFADNLYPYGDRFADFFLFKYGYLGVRLFFMISGFVIFMTLDRSQSLKEFFIRRWSRLFPSMLVCSIIIFGLAQIIPAYQFPANWKDILPGLVFVHPDWISFFTSTHLDGIESAYWTLYTEVKFYVLIGLIYFGLSKKHSLAIFTCFIAGMIISTLLVMRFFPFTNALMYQIRGNLDLIQFPWFCVGMAVYSFYKRNHDRFTVLWLVLSLFYIIYYAQGVLPTIITIVIFLLPFLIGSVRKILSASLITLVGAFSYPLYLLHQNLGVSLIKVSSDYITESLASYLPFALYIGFCLVSYLIYSFVEKPSQFYIRKLVYKNTKHENELPQGLLKSKVSP